METEEEQQQRSTRRWQRLQRAASVEELVVPAGANAAAGGGDDDDLEVTRDPTVVRGWRRLKAVSMVVFSGGARPNTTTTTTTTTVNFPFPSIPSSFAHVIVFLLHALGIVLFYNNDSKSIYICVFHYHN